MAEEGEKVMINVYDLSQGLARQLSTTLLGKAIEGIWHTGVVVYGKEYYFGGGIQHNSIGQTPYGKPCKVVDLGVTHVPMEVFEGFLEEISPRYTAETYSLLHHNCNNFSNEIAQFLVGCNIPDFILRLPQDVMNSPMGPLIMPMIMQFEATLRYGGVPQVPHLGASLPKSNLVRQQGIPKLPNKPKDRGGSDSVTIETKVSSNIPPAVEPVSHQLNDSTNSNDKEPDSCNEGPVKSGSNCLEDAALTKDPLGDERTKVQEEITSEFATLMANGSLRASEAAAIATRRVMEKHASLSATPSRG